MYIRRPVGWAFQLLFTRGGVRMMPCIPRPNKHVFDVLYSVSCGKQQFADVSKRRVICLAGTLCLGLGYVLPQRSLTGFLSHRSRVQRFGKVVPRERGRRCKHWQQRTWLTVRIMFAKYYGTFRMNTVPAEVSYCSMYIFNRTRQMFAPCFTAIEIIERE
jgi:hypothetical protein